MGLSVSENYLGDMHCKAVVRLFHTKVSIVSGYLSSRQNNLVKIEKHHYAIINNHNGSQ